MSFANPKNIEDAKTRKSYAVERYRAIQAELAAIPPAKSPAENKAKKKKKSELVRLMTPVLSELSFLKQWIKGQNVKTNDKLRSPHKALRKSTEILRRSRSLFASVAQGSGISKDEALIAADEITQFLLSDELLEYFSVEETK